MPIVLQDDESHGVNLRVRVRSHHHVHLFFSQSSIKQSEIHDARRFAKMQTIELRETVVAIRPLEKLIPNAHAQLWGVLRQVRDRAQAQAAGVVTANRECETVVESQR